MLIKDLKYPWQRSELLLSLKGFSIANTYDLDALHPDYTNYDGYSYGTYVSLGIESFINDYDNEEVGHGVGELFRNDYERAVVCGCSLFLGDQIVLDTVIHPGNTDATPADCIVHPKWPEFEVMCKKAIALLEENDCLAAQQP